MFTLALKGYNLNFKAIFKAAGKSTTKTEDGISGFQALMISTATRIGSGNIAGVSAAILTGGPGALFWMWMTAFIGMATAFVEGVLGQLYKQKHGNIYIGGAPWYLEKGTGSRLLGSLYAIFAVIMFGTAWMGIQSNTIAANFYRISKGFMPGTEIQIKIGVGIILATIMTMVCIGGIKRIGEFASKLMPVMSIGYLIVAIVVIFNNIDKTGLVWKQIFAGAFGTKQIAGGVIGFSVKQAVSKGVARGSFSNEAGLGSASFAAGASNSKHPIQQGLLQSFSTFIDTIIICSASGMLILHSGVWQTHDPSQSGTLILASIAKQFGAGPSEWIMFFAVFLFSLTSIIGLFYYAETAFIYLFGNKNKTVIYAFTISVAAYLVYSSFAKVDIIWALGDAGIIFLATFNVIGMLIQLPTVKKLLADYKSQIQKSDKQPVFKVDKSYGPKVTLWK